LLGLNSQFNLMVAIKNHLYIAMKGGFLYQLTLIRFSV